MKQKLLLQLALFFNLPRAFSALSLRKQKQRQHEMRVGRHSTYIVLKKTLLAGSSS
jgi:hypothetical protein